LNLIAFVIMFPASYVLSPRWFHKINVTAIRLTSFPILLGIAFYERQIAPSRQSPTLMDRASQTATRLLENMPRRLKRFSLFEGFAGPGGDIDAIFEIEEEISRPRDRKTETVDQPSFSDGRRSTSVTTPALRASKPVMLDSLHSPNQSSSVKNTSVDSIVRRRRHSELPRGSKGVMRDLLSDNVQPAFTPLMRLFQPVVEEEGGVLGSGSQAPNYGKWGSRESQTKRDLSVLYDEVGDDARARRQASGDDSRQTDADGWREPRPVRDVQEEEDREEPWQEQEFRSKLDQIERREQRMEELLAQILQQLG